MVKILTQKIPPILGNYSPELKAIVYEMLDFEAQKRPSVQKILDKPFIKQFLNQTLEKTINIYDENNQDKLRKDTSTNKLCRKRSANSLSSSILSSKSRNQNLSSEDYLKMIEYKQSYPVVLEENKFLKKELEALKKEREVLEEKSTQLLTRLR
jgi:serine/threonine protein kinase